MKFSPAVPLFLACLAACQPSPDDTGPGDSGSLELSLESGALYEAGAGTSGHLLPQEAGFRLGVERQEQGYLLLDFDEAWNQGELEWQLSGPNPREPDHDLVQAEQGLFLALLTSSEDGVGAAVRRFDEDYELTAFSGNLLASEDERSLDPNLLVTEDRVWLGMEYREDGAQWSNNIPPNAEVERGMMLRELDTDLVLLDTHELTADIPGSSTPGQYWGLGANQLRQGASHWVFAASPSGEEGQFEEGESEGTRRIWALEYDLELDFQQALGPLTPPEQDAYWCTGLVTVGELILLSYTFREAEDGPVLGPPTPDGGNIGVLALDADLQVIASTRVTEHDPQEIADNLGAHRSSLAARGEELWVTWDAGMATWVRELELVWEDE